MPEFVKVATVDEVPPGKLKEVKIEGKPIVLANVNGQIFAVGGICSHADLPLGMGYLEGHELECVFHGGRYDIRTGEVTGMPPTNSIPVYEVQIEGNDIKIAKPEP